MTNSELQWEIQENKNKVQENKEEIDSLINNESFFSDFKEEFEYFDINSYNNKIKAFLESEALKI